MIEIKANRRCTAMLLRTNLGDADAHMFVVWLGALITAALTVEPALFGPTSGSRIYDGTVTIILLLTVWFANVAEALAEGRGKAKANALRQTRIELVGRRIAEFG